MRRFAILKAFVLSALIAGSQDYKFPLPSYTPDSSNLAAREQFRDMKFGLFIHWGVYSLLGDGEWIMHNRKIPYSSYQRLADFFNPTAFDAKEWVQMAKSAGMKYITITSRHHDGFSMFDTKASGYDIVDATPYKKDPLMELALEAKKEGIGLRFYYSLLDWGRDDYGFGKRIRDGKPVDTDWERYISFMKTQLTELITRYPNVSGIWFDGHWERPDANWRYEELYGLIHKLNPAIMIGNNHHRVPMPGEDFQMFEKDLPGENSTGFRASNSIADMPLETCETINNSWGFNINDRNYKTSRQIIRMMVGAAGRNANFLLNVGPMPNGKIQSEFADTLKVVGRWMETYGETIYGTRGGAVPPQDWGVVTVKGNTIYAHVLRQPKENYIFIPIRGRKLRSAVSFMGKSKLKFSQYPEGVFVYMGEMSLDPVDSIIQLETELKSK